MSKIAIAFFIVLGERLLSVPPRRSRARPSWRTWRTRTAGDKDNKVMYMKNGTPGQNMGSERIHTSF